VDGQAVLVNVAILVYALILVGAVTVIDRFLQRHHHRPRNR
jgi:hypothetical protein